MSSAPSRCPNPRCACPVQAGDLFCPHCGQDLSVAAGGATTEAAAGYGAPLRLEPVGLAPLPTATASAQGQVAEPAAATEPSTSRGSLPSDCPDLEVSYNNSCVFVLDMQSTFDFRVRPLGDGIRELYVEVQQSGRVIARETPMVRPRRGAWLDFSLNYTPSNTRPGKAAFSIVVGYRKGDQRRVYAAYRTHTIYSGKEDPRRVCENLMVEVKNNIQQGHAGDLRVDQSFDSLREALRERSTIALDREFLQLINTRPIWASLPLAECGTDAVGPVPAPAPPPARPGPQRLILQPADGAGIQLSTQPAFRIGRKKDCEILARVYDPTGRELRDPTVRVSRYHACVEWQGDQGWLRDGGFYREEDRWKPSASGTWVDGQRVPENGFVLAPAREYKVALAKPVPGETPDFQWSARLWTVRDLPPLRPGCPARKAALGAPACLALRRLPSPGGSALLLRQGAKLAWADTRCGGACVCICEDILYFSDGQSCAPLVPGQSVRAGIVDFQVVEAPTAGEP